MLNRLKNNSFLFAVLIVSSTAIVMMIAEERKETPEIMVESNQQTVRSEVAAATTNEVVETNEAAAAHESELTDSTATDSGTLANSQAQAKRTVSSTNPATSSSTKTAQKQVTISTNSSSSTGNVFRSLEGKVTSYNSNQITIEVPIEGLLTLAINSQTMIRDQHHPIRVGSLVDVDAQGNVAYKIETERVVEGHGTIVNVTSNSVTIEKSGKQVTFTKAPHFYMDTDGYSGNVAGLWAEYTLTSENKIIGLDGEIDDQYDDDDHD